jgi:hypothetical protein
MLARSRPWLGGLLIGLALGVVLGAATITRGALGRGDLEDRLAALDAVLRHVTVVEGPLDGLPGPHLVFEGVNVHVRSGSGRTDDGVPEGGTLTGLGNLLVGYNAPPDGLNPPEREGSHNLIVGDEHRYASWGGFVAGLNNTIAQRNASVSGGQRNIVSGAQSSVSGGQNNVVSGFQSSISGGQFNEVTANQSSISGGQNNTVSSTQSSISGGESNTVSASRASISGGNGLTVSTTNGWAAGTFASP